MKWYFADKVCRTWEGQGAAVSASCTDYWSWECQRLAREKA